MANDQINVPSLIVILVLSGLIVRYLFFSTPAQQQQQQPRDSLAQMRQREAGVERIQQMFPQVDRRTILWDLQRNGGNIAATTERILAGRMETVRFLSNPLFQVSLDLVLIIAHYRRPTRTRSTIVFLIGSRR